LVISIESNIADFGRFSGAIDGSDARSPAPRLLPRIGPPPVVEATQWHAANYAAGDKTQQVGKNRANQLITERTLSWPFPSICRPLLRARRQRPRRRAAEQRDERAAFHGLSPRPSISDQV
jgi:hypothetical protein